MVDPAVRSGLGLGLGLRLCLTRLSAQVIYELVAKFQTNVYIGGSCMFTGKTFCRAIENGVVS